MDQNTPQPLDWAGLVREFATRLLEMEDSPREDCVCQAFHPDTLHGAST